MEKYKCEICGKNHTIYSRMIIPLPRMIQEMPEEEREERVHDMDEFLVVDGELVFANGWVNIYVEKHESPFYSWKTWSSISRKKFSENLEELNAGKVIEFEGNLEEDVIPFYPNSMNLETNTLIQLTDEGLLIEIQVIEESQLKEDQSKPITEKRMIEIMQMMYHNPESEEGPRFEKSFKQRLLTELENAESEYIVNEKDFVINLSTEVVLFQIISNTMLEANRIDERGFGLHLSFDQADDKSTEEITKFRSKEYIKDFVYHNLDDIPTYQLDFGIDKKRLEKMVRQILVDVYEEDLESIETDSFEA